MENELKGTEEKVTKTFEQMSESLENLESSEEVASEEPKAEEPKAEEPKAEEVASEEPEEEPEEEPKAEEVASEEPEAEEVASEEPEAEEVASEEPKAEEPKAEDSDLIATIKPLLVKANNYSFLNCGRHLKNEINEENLKLFYDEFVAYGVSSAIDIEVLEILRKAFK